MALNINNLGSRGTFSLNSLMLKILTQVREATSALPMRCRSLGKACFLSLVDTVVRPVKKEKVDRHETVTCWSGATFRNDNTFGAYVYKNEVLQT
jgi:hypothetical protein